MLRAERALRYATFGSLDGCAGGWLNQGDLACLGNFKLVSSLFMPQVQILLLNLAASRGLAILKSLVTLQTAKMDPAKLIINELGVVGGHKGG